MRTLILAERPLRDLRSAAILNQLPARVAGATEQLAIIPAALPAPDPALRGASRIVIAGVFQERVELERALGMAAQGVAAGARLEARTFSLERSAARREAPKGVAVLDHATVLETRDAHTANALLVWRVAAPVGILAYPERHAEPDPSLAEGLPGERILGLAILGDPDTTRALAAQHAALAEALSRVQGWPVLPLPAEAPGSGSDDLRGSLNFAAALLPGAEILLPGLSDQAWRRTALTAGRLRALAARCALVVTNQDLVAACAIEAGVPVLGLWAGEDRRIASCLATLANEAAEGTRLLRLKG